jgi:hypothetical protein
MAHVLDPTQLGNLIVALAIAAATIIRAFRDHDGQP